MSEHTPREWTLSELTASLSEIVLEKVVYQNVLQANGGVVASVWSRESDARLIAAAPELLAACEAMAEWFDAESLPNFNGTAFYERMQMCRKAEDLSREAIKKARGTI